MTILYLRSLYTDSINTVQCACSRDVIARYSGDTAAQDDLKLALSEATFAHWVLVVHLEGADNIIRTGVNIYHACRCVYIYIHIYIFIKYKYI
jgi:uncharacterized MAPEG superfamily protein